MIEKAYIAQKEKGANGGMLFASATFAKTPDTMSLYLSTYIGQMILNNQVSVEELNDIITKGGYGLTEVITKELARRGEYSRVELDMSGIEYDFNVRKIAEGGYNDISRTLQNLFVFDADLASNRDSFQAIKGFDDKGKADLYIAPDKQQYADARISFNPFANVMHNLRQQVMLSLKTQGMIDETLAAIERGEKPVVVLFNTNESFLKYMVDEGEIKVGDVIDKTLADFYVRYLKSSLRYKITIPKKGTSKDREVIEEGDLPLTSEDLNRFEALRDHFFENDTLTSTEYAISPIDKFLTSLGDKTSGEITGRGYYVDYSTTPPTLQSKPKENQNEIIDAFNDGTTDALIINQSGSTGISLHASEKFKDQKKRIMIFTQALPDVNDMMQVGGRVNRLGQVVKPSYQFLGSNAPPEMRDMSLLIKKLSSLNAHIKGSADTTLADVDSIDFSNEIANSAVKQFLLNTADGRAINMMLGFAVSQNTTLNSVIKRVLNRSILIGDMKQEQEAIAMVKEVVDQRIKALQMADRSTGEGIDTIENAQAEVLDQKYMDNGDYMRLWEMNRRKKPLARENVYQIILDKLGREDSDVDNLDWKSVAQESYALIADRIDQVAEAERAKGKDKEKIDAQEKKLLNIAKSYPAGRGVRTITSDGIIHHAVMTDIKPVKTVGDAMKYGAWNMYFVIPGTGDRQIMRLSAIEFLNEREGATAVGDTQLGFYEGARTIEEVFRRVDNQPRKMRVEVVHGDLIKAMLAMGGIGKIVQFNDIDGNIQIGLQLPFGTKFEEIQKADRRIPNVESLISFADFVKTEIKPDVLKTKSLAVSMVAGQTTVRIKETGAMKKLIEELGNIANTKENQSGYHYLYFNGQDEQTQALRRIARNHRLLISLKDKPAWDKWRKIKFSVRFESGSAEADYQSGKIRTLADNRFIAAVKHAIGGWPRLVRHYYRLKPTDPRFVKLIEALMRKENSAMATNEMVSNNMKRVMSGLPSDKQDVLNRYFLLKDLQWTMSVGKKVPMFENKEELDREVARFTKLVNEDPVLKERVAIRDEILEDLRAQLLENGVMTKDQLKNKDYYRHQVLEYRQMKKAQMSSLGGSSKIRRTIIHARMGSEKKINTNYFEAEAEWMARAYDDIATAKLLNFIRDDPINVLPQIKAQGKKENNLNLINKLSSEVMDFIKRDDDIDWQADKEAVLSEAGGMIDSALTPKELSDTAKAIFKQFANEKPPKGAFPSLSKYMEFNTTIARTLSMIRNGLEEVPIEMIPLEFRADYERFLKGKGTSDAVEATQNSNLFGLMGWLNQNEEFVDLQNLTSILSSTIAKRESFKKELLGDKYVNIRNTLKLVKHFYPDGSMRVWQPDSFDGFSRKIHFFKTKTLTHRVYDMAIDKLTEALDRDGQIEASYMKAILEMMREQLVKGGPMEEFVLPTEVVETLNQFYDRRDDAFLAPIGLAITNAIKRMLLFFPQAYMKYILNNLSGDTDAISMSPLAPQIFKKLPVAAKMVSAVMYGRIKKIEGLYKEALDLGILHSNLIVAELQNPFSYQINQFSDLDIAKKDPELYKRILKSPMKYMHIVQKASIWRENVFRLAAYLAYRDESVSKGRSILEVGYGASNPKILRELADDPKVLSARMARDTIGDYTNISHSGKYMARFYLLFYRWVESNLRKVGGNMLNIYRYPRDVYKYEMLMGMPKEQARAKAFQLAGQSAKRVGKKFIPFKPPHKSLGRGVRSAVMTYKLVRFFGALLILRHLFFDDEDDLENTEERMRMHIPVAKSGDTYWTARIQGSLSDALGLFGLEDVVSTIAEYRQNRASIGDVAAASAIAPVNRAATAFNPVFRMPIEIAMGERVYPSLLNMQPIDDDFWIYFFDSFRLGPEARALSTAMGNPQPQKPYTLSNRLKSFILYERTVGEMAWRSANAIIYSYADHMDKGYVRGKKTEKSKQLANVFNSMRFGNEKTESLAREKLKDMGVTDKEIEASMKRRGVRGALSRMGEDARQDIYDDLSLKEYDILRKALSYEAKVLNDGDVPVEYRRMIFEIQEAANQNIMRLNQ